MEKPVLLYDAKCQICRNLALKVQANARRPIDVLALSDPEATSRLERFYPGGWKHDFYLLENGSCRRGVRALPTLAGILGMRRLGALLGEYVAYQRARAQCEQQPAEPALPVANGTSRRQILAMAAAAPLLAPFGRIGRLDDPFEGADDERVKGIAFHLASVWRDESGELRTDVRRISEASRRAIGGFRKPAGETTILHRDHAVLAESGAVEHGELRSTTAHSTPSAKDLPAGERFVVRRSSLQGERKLDGGGTEARFVDSYGVGLEEDRYSLSINVGNGTLDAAGGTIVATTMSGMLRHDLALPMVDFVVFAGDGTDDAAALLAGHLAGVRALSRFHADAGRPRVATLYREMEAGLERAIELYAGNVGEHLVPIKNKLVITSMPELLQFVDLKSELTQLAERLPSGSGMRRMVGQQVEVDEGGGCDCTCGCGCCCGCGCGCGCGLCGCSCICFCCCECGCSCGCGCCL